jgi:outer membrane protein TolC
MNQIKIISMGAMLIFVISTNSLKPVHAGELTGNVNILRENPPTSKTSRSISENQDSLTLNQCIKIALENNPLIGYKSWEIEEVNAQIKEASSQRWPHLGAVGNYYHYSDTQRLAPPRRPDYPLIFADDVISCNLVMTMPLFTGGRITNQIETTKLILRSAKYSLDYTRQELIFNVTSVYFSILKQQKIIESLDFSRTTLEGHLKRVKELIAAKKATRLDKLRIEVRLANIIQRIEQEENILAVQNRSLANLMGIEEINFNIPPKSDLQLAEPKMGLEENLDQAYTHRADYLAVQKEVAAQATRVKAAKAAFWPSISLYASYGVKKAVGSFIKPPEIDDYEDIGQVGVFLEIPFFDGGKTKSNVQQEKAKLALLKEKLRALKLNIRLDVETVIFNIISTGKRISATEKAIEQANESLRIEMEKYNLGKGSITDIFDAESALLEVQTIYYIALSDYNIYSAQLKFVQGKL